MSDNIDRLFQAARSAKPDTARVEYGFETRLLAELRADRRRPAPWFAFAWKLVPVFVAVVVVIGVWNRVVFAPVSLETAIGGTAVIHFPGE
jgi:hypothetical protein